MTFLYPLGFLALIAIPVLVFIYIIKNRYTEQTVASTYLWTLSEKFIRRRIPINRITGLLSLILQILAVALISVILAHPVLSIKDGAMEYCFILDGSGSMNIAQGGSTRFEEGKKKISEMIKDSMNGSTYTLIFAGDEVFSESFTDKDSALDALSSDMYNVSYSNVSPSAALEKAQTYFNEHPSVKTYLITDRTYAETGNLKVINLNSANVNYGISDVEYDYDLNGNLVITGNVISYGSAATLNIDFYFDGSKTRYGTQQVSVPSYEDYLAELESAEGEDVEVQKTFTYTNDLKDFESFKVVIRQKDSLALDNEVIVFNVAHSTYEDTLLVYGKTITKRTPLETSYVAPDLVEWALVSAHLGQNQLKIIKDTEYNPKEYSGYGLYIFQNCVPDEMPKDGVVWFINPTASVEGSNFNFQGEVRASGAAKYSTNTDTSLQSRLEGIVKSNFELDYYAKIGKSGGDFQVLAECDKNPLILVGSNAYGNREVIFAFDFRASAQFVLSVNCPTIVSNMLKYSFPSVVEKTSFMSGDTLVINILNGCENVRIDTPLGHTEYPDISTATSEYSLTEVGVYTVTMTIKDIPDDKVFYVYSALPVEERELKVQDEAFVIMGEAKNEKLPGKYDNLLVIFIILAVIAVADFGVYCYEQYQLR